MCGLVPQCSLALLDFLDYTRLHGTTPDFVETIEAIHKLVEDDLHDSSCRYKTAVDKHHRVVLTNDRLPPHEYNNMHSKKIGVVEILKCIDSNIYRVRLPNHIWTDDVLILNILIHFARIQTLERIFSYLEGLMQRILSFTSSFFYKCFR